MDLRKLPEDRSIQEVIDSVGEGSRDVLRPSWATALGTHKKIGPGRTYLWESYLTSGKYFMVCAEDEPHRVWWELD